MKYLAITAVLCLILAGASFAGNVTMTEVITGGTLTLTMPENFSLTGITLGGSSQQDTGVGFANYSIEDSRGSGAGWNLGFSISQFTTAGTPARTIPTANFDLNIGQDSISHVYGQSIDVDHGPKTLLSSGANITTEETKGVTSEAGYGLGSYGVMPNHILRIDANTYAGTYTATLTATLNAVP